MPNSPIAYYKRAADYIFSRYILNRPYLIGSSEEYGLRLKFKTQDGGGRAIFKKGTYEPEITELLIRNLKLKDGDVVLDVGANIGWYSSLISRFEHADIKIHCFEPDPDNYDCLIHNLKLNHADKVSAHNLGVSDTTGTKTLYLYKKSNTGRHSMLEINTGDSIDVKTVSFDDFLKEQQIDVSKVKFLKIDIEGFEYYAFKGGSQLLGSLPYIIAEYSPGYMRKGGVDPADLIQLMKAHNYSPHKIDQGIQEVGEAELLAREHNINILWVKSGYPVWQ
ncbi:MAG: FkbM family methyltransferase [Bacteroidota bacterium]